ncbi:hypothetical protein ES703_16692 [subsurface metagenome]
MEQPKQEICTIRIMFPVETDEQAIEYKRKIAEVLKDKPDATIQFSLMTPPPMPNIR